QRAGENLAVITKEHLFAKRFAEALSHATVNLPVENHGVDDNAAVIDQEKFLKCRRPRLPIDSDHRQMRAEAPGFTLRIKEGSFLKARFHTARNISSIRGGGNLAPRNFFLRHSSHREAAIRLNDILG